MGVENKIIVLVFVLLGPYCMVPSCRSFEKRDMELSSYSSVLYCNVLC